MATYILIDNLGRVVGKAINATRGARGNVEYGGRETDGAFVTVGIARILPLSVYRKRVSSGCVDVSELRSYLVQ